MSRRQVSMIGVGEKRVGDVSGLAAGAPDPPGVRRRGDVRGKLDGDDFEPQLAQPWHDAARGPISRQDHVRLERKYFFNIWVNKIPDFINFIRLGRIIAKCGNPHDRIPGA